MEMMPHQNRRPPPRGQDRRQGPEPTPRRVACPIFRQVDEQPVFLIVHLFSGRRRLGDFHDQVHHFTQQLPFQVVVLSMDTAVSHDLGDLSMNLDSWKKLLSCYEAGRVAATLCGPPCETFSEERFTQPSDADVNWPRPVRSALGLFVLPGLTMKELRQVSCGSLFFLQCIVVLALRMQWGGLFVAEHPAPPSAEAIKPTGLLAWGLLHFQRDLYRYADLALARPTTAAIGKDAESNFRTSRHKEYPTMLCRALAAAFTCQLNRNVASSDTRFSGSDDFDFWVDHTAPAGNRIDAAGRHTSNSEAFQDAWNRPWAYLAAALELAAAKANLSSTKAELAELKAKRFRAEQQALEALRQQGKLNTRLKANATRLARSVADAEEELEYLQDQFLEAQHDQTEAKKELSEAEKALQKEINEHSQTLEELESADHRISRITLSFGLVMGCMAIIIVALGSALVVCGRKRAAADISVMPIAEGASENSVVVGPLGLMLIDGGEVSNGPGSDPCPAKTDELPTLLTNTSLTRCMGSPMNKPAASSADSYPSSQTHLATIVGHMIPPLSQWFTVSLGPTVTFQPGPGLHFPCGLV
eukprot:s2976_g8.t1